MRNSKRAREWGAYSAGGRRCPPPSTRQSCAPSEKVWKRNAQGSCGSQRSSTIAAAPSPIKCALSGSSQFTPRSGVSAQTITARSYASIANSPLTVCNATTKPKQLECTSIVAQPDAALPSASCTSAELDGIGCCTHKLASTSRSIARMPNPAENSASVTTRRAISVPPSSAAASWRKRTPVWRQVQPSSNPPRRSSSSALTHLRGR